MRNGQPPEGVPTSYTVTDFWCHPGTGWCYPNPPGGPFSPEVPGGTDPCVGFCIRLHEWYHYTDNRRFRREHLFNPVTGAYNDVWFGIHREKPAYELERSCLLSF